MRDFHTMIRFITNKYGASLETNHLLKFPLGRRNRDKVLEELKAEAKPNVTLEFLPWDNGNWTKGGYSKLYIDINPDEPIEVELLTGPITKPAGGDPLYRDMVAKSREAGGNSWYIVQPGRYCWARFLEGPMKGDICTPALGPGVEPKAGTKAMVYLTVQNGTIYGRTRLVEK